MTTPDAPPPYRPLLRTHDDRVVAGVAGGLGRWLDIDPVILRVTFAVLTLFGGLGLVGYLIGYLLIPDEATGTPLVSSHVLPDLRRLTPQQRALAGWAVAALAVIVAIAGHRSTTVAVLIIVAAVVVLATREGRRPVGATAFTPAPPPQPDYAFSPPPVTVTPPPSTSYAWTPSPPPAFVVADRGPRLNRALISASVLAAGVYLLIGQAGAYKTLALQAIAVALTTLGVGLAATAWRARSRGALVLGVLLSLVVMVGSVVEGDYGSSIGKRVWRPTDTTSIAGTYQLAVGNGTLDLTQLTTQLDGRTITVTMGGGTLTVLMPDGVPFSAYGDVGVGSLDIFGDRWDGPVTETVSTPGWTPSTGLRLRLHLRVGHVEVQHG
jgi:phage shock protein PspC (stress-responsive transcriptional regulator)